MPASDVRRGLPGFALIVGPELARGATHASQKRVVDVGDDDLVDLFVARAKTGRIEGSSVHRRCRPQLRWVKEMMPTASANASATTG
jgi:hypothetical protein